MPKSPGNVPKGNNELIATLKAKGFSWQQILDFLEYLFELFQAGGSLKAKKAGCDDQCECYRTCLCHALQIAQHQLEGLEACDVDPPVPPAP